MGEISTGQTQRTLALDAEPFSLAKCFAAFGASRGAKDLEDDDIVGLGALSRSRHMVPESQDATKSQSAWSRSELARKVCRAIGAEARPESDLIHLSAAVSRPSKKSASGHRGTAPRAPPSTNTSRSSTGRNAFTNCSASGAPNAERWADSAENFRS